MTFLKASALQICISGLSFFFSTKVIVRNGWFSLLFRETDGPTVPAAVFVCAVALHHAFECVVCGVNALFVSPRGCWLVLFVAAGQCIRCCLSDPSSPVDDAATRLRNGVTQRLRVHAFRIPPCTHSRPSRLDSDQQPSLRRQLPPATRSSHSLRHASQGQPVELHRSRIAIGIQ
jgi:hypothetical protein